MEFLLQPDKMAHFPIIGGRVVFFTSVHATGGFLPMIVKWGKFDLI